MSDYEPTAGDMVRVQGGKQYLPAAQRVQWMRGDHPDWTIDTSVYLLDWERGYAVMRAEIRNEEGRIIGAGTKTETRSGFGDFVEKAETGAVGRALARAGYGTEDALDLEGDRFADAPIEQPQGGERVARTHGRRAESRQPATTRPAAQRTPEEEALLTELLGVVKSRAQLDLLHKAVDVKGERATADELREMIAIAQRPLPIPAAGAGQDAPASAGEAARSGAASPDSNAEPGLPGADSATSVSAPLSPGGAAPAAPTDAEILAAAGEGSEMVPPKPGTAEYKALPNGTDRARAKAYHDALKRAEPHQPSLAEALGGPSSD